MFNWKSTELIDSLYDSISSMTWSIAAPVKSQILPFLNLTFTDLVNANGIFETTTSVKISGHSAMTLSGRRWLRIGGFLLLLSWS
jgi:hypothetical protein